MNNKTSFRNIRIELRKQAAALLLCLSLTASLLSADLSLSKYVLNTTIHTISLTSGVTESITAIDAITGTTQVGYTLTAGAVTPAGATCAYQWLRCATSGGTYENITGATSNTYILQADDANYYIKVSATGTGSYTGSATSTFAGPVTPEPIPLSAIGPISGTAQVGQTLSAGAVTPVGATCVYQWQRCATSDGTYTDISGASSNTYILQADDANYYIRVSATGTGDYSGTVSSEYTGPVAPAIVPMTAIGAITGTVQVGQTLTAGAVTPVGATCTYQWQRCATSNGTYTNISGATSITYSLLSSDLNYYLKVVATGTGAYTGSVTSAFVGPVTPCPITALGAISGTTAVGQTLTVGALVPSGATATYQWMKCSTPDGVYSNIYGATSGTYTLTSQERDYYIKVTATGTGSYTGTVMSTYAGPCVRNSTPITAISPIIGALHVGSTLTAGALTPADATATYQWQRCATLNGTYTNIGGATASTYTLTASDFTSYLRVVATGNGSYSGTVTSTSAGPVTSAPITAIGIISGTTTIDQILTAGVLTPPDATVSYQWKKCDTQDGTYVNIDGANSNTYTIIEADLNYYFKVTATGTGCYYGEATSPFIGPATQIAQPITALSPISGIVQVGQTLTAGAPVPTGATVVYQWQRSSAPGGPYSDISGATSGTYTLLDTDVNSYIKVVATGTGLYTGSAASDSAGPVNPCPITSIGPIIGTTKQGEIITAGAVTPAGATVTYQWQRCATPGGTYTNIAGATSNIYTIQGIDMNYYFKVVATGTGGYSGTVTSAYSGPGVKKTTQITSIGAISGTVQAGQTLTAGALTPAGATATYQWQRCNTLNGTYINIVGATSSTYTLSASDINYYLKIVATGSGVYEGTVTSAAVGPVTPSQITGIGVISGTVQAGQTLTAGALTPVDATATYQWQRCDTLNGTYINIVGATSSSITLTASDINFYIKVTAMGSGIYAGTVTSAAVGPVDAYQITGIEAIDGTAQVGQTLTAGALTPASATATFQWQRCDLADGTYEDIIGATSNTYDILVSDINYYFKVVATGTGIYEGTITSAYIGPVTEESGLGAKSLTASSDSTLTTIWEISGTPEVGQTLTAGELTPPDMAVTYQWQRCDTPDGTYENIVGAASNAYTILASDVHCYLRVVAVNPETDEEIMASTPIGPVLEAPVDQMPVAGADSGADSDSDAGADSGADSDSDADADADADTVVEAAPVIDAEPDAAADPEAEADAEPDAAADPEADADADSSAITGISEISGVPEVGQTLTAGALSPADATAAYQWQSCNTADGSYTDIEAANSDTYTLSASDVNAYIRVAATGTGAYAGTVTSAPVGPVAAAPVSISEIPAEAPVAGGIPQTALIETTEYTAAITWEPADGTFELNVAYTATITITANSGYTLTGVPADFFSVTGAESSANSADSCVVTAIFPPAV